MEPKDRGRVTRPAVISLSLCSVPESLEPPEGPAEEGRSGSTDTFPKGQIVGAGFLVFQHYLPQLLNSTGEVGEQLQGWLAAAGDLPPSARAPGTRLDMEHRIHGSVDLAKISLWVLSRLIDMAIHSQHIMTVP